MSGLFLFNLWSFRREKEIKIIGITVFVNPYTEPDEEEEREKKEKEDKEKKELSLQEREEQEKFGNWYSNPRGPEGLVPRKEGVGRYLKLPPSGATAAKKRAAPGLDGSKTGGLDAKGSTAFNAEVFGLDEEASLAEMPEKKRKESVSGVSFGDFSSW